MPPRVRLLRVRFGMVVTAPVRLPPYKGDMLRRALLWHLGTRWCRQPERCRNGCQAPGVCLFGRLFEPPLDPSWSQSVRRLMGPTPPPAYVLWDERDRRREVNPGDRFQFELTLIGEAAARQVAAFVAAMTAGGEQGIGRESLRARLDRVDVLAGAGGQAHPLLVDGVWKGDPVDGALVGYGDGEMWAEQATPSGSGPLTRIRLCFHSPVTLKERGKVVGRPDFRPLARAIVRRLRILSEVHGGGEWPRSEYGPLLDLADEVQLEHHEMAWDSTVRRGQRGTMAMEGFLGQAWYVSRDDLRPLLPVLWLGQWVHVGKGTVWGHGRYALEIESDR